MKCRLPIALSLAIAFFGLWSPTTAYADTPVVVDCGDGAPLSANVDALTLTKLTASVQSILDNPSGTTCSLAAGTLDPTLTGGSNPFVVGGGRYARGAIFGPNTASYQCGINFSMSAHKDQDGYHGHQSYTVNNVDGCSPYSGHISANVTCFAVNGNVAEIRGLITDVSGFYATPGLLDGLHVFVSEVTDNGPPSALTRDMVYLTDDFDGTENDCTAPGAYSVFERPIDNGNITVHD